MTLNLSWLKPHIRRIAPKPFEVRSIRVAAPPCSSCQNWSPRVAGNGAESLTNSGSGYRFCWAPKGMKHDFSCFTSRVPDGVLFSDLDAVQEKASSSQFLGVASGRLPYGHDGGQW